MLQELMTASFDYQTNNLYTAMPGVVVVVRNDLEQLSVDVQPTVNIKNYDGTTKERTVVLNVPVQMPSSSTAALTFPVNVGDPVLLIYSMRSLDTWKRGSGSPIVPNDTRKFDKRDCIAIPGIWPFGRSINSPSVRIWQHSTGDLVIANNIGSSAENEVRLKSSGDIQINTNQDVFVVCNNANVTAQQDITLNCANFDLTATTATFDIGSTTWIGNIDQTGGYTQTGTYTLDSININLHKHTETGTITLGPQN
jgi:hypothetical protein